MTHRARTPFKKCGCRHPIQVRYPSNNIASMSAFGRPPPLLAARQTSGEPSRSGSDSNGHNPDTPQHGRNKRTLIESACSACRRRKSRVSGGIVCDHARLATDLNFSVTDPDHHVHAARHFVQSAITKPKRVSPVGLPFDVGIRSWRRSAPRSES